MGNSLVCKDLAQRQGGGWPGVTLFEKLNLEWHSPSIQVIMGASGFGKSSFIKTIAGVWPPDKGEVFIAELPLWNSSGDLQNQRLLPRLGFAFQNNALFSSMSNLENLTFPHKQRFPEFNSQARQALALEWLEKVGLKKNAYDQPHELSGGMQKRLALARTLILEPEYIFLDDPTAGLDPITSREMGSLINQLLEEKEALVVIVTNDPERAEEWGPNIHFLHHGKLHLKNSEHWKEVFQIYL